MKPTTQASIGRIAFTLEEEAYSELKKYISSLEAHFSSSSSGQEVIEEIEVRIAELLLERCGTDGVVDLGSVNHVIHTLGNVEDIDSGREDGKDSEETAGDPKKKLFRDPSDRILGGVCSGLAAYFGTDTALLRLAGIALFILCAVIGHGSGLWIPIVIYVALWISMPAARTVEQRYRMRGEANDLNSIMNNIGKNIGKNAAEIEKTAKDFNREHPDFWRTFARAFGIVVGIILIITATSGLLGTFIVTTGVVAALPVSVAAIVGSITGPGTSVLLSICLPAIVGIPLVGILYAGIILAFNLKSPKWHPGLILFLLWLASIGGLAYAAARTAIRYDNNDRQTATATYRMASDTLRISLSGSEMDYNYIYMNADKDEYRLLLFDNDDIYMYPEIKVKRIRNAEKGEILVKSGTWYFNSRSGSPDFYSISGNILTLEPSVLEKGRQLTEAGRQLTIEVPESMELRVDSPRYHDFKDNIFHTNIALLKHCR